MRRSSPIANVVPITGLLCAGGALSVPATAAVRPAWPSLNTTTAEAPAAAALAALSAKVHVPRWTSAMWPGVKPAKSAASHALVLPFAVARRRDDEVDRGHRSRDVTVGREGHRGEVDAVHIVGRIRRDLREHRRRPVGVEGEDERHHRHVVPGRLELADDVVLRVVEALRPGHSVAAVRGADRLERVEVFVHSGGGDRLPQALGAGQVTRVLGGLGRECRREKAATWWPLQW